MMQRKNTFNTTFKADLLVCYKILHNWVHLDCDDFFRARVLIVLEAIQ